MSRKAKGQQVGVALFPFLAVLICTMGALIVLLVLLVQQARVDASAVAAAQAGANGGEAQQRIRERIEDAEWQRQMLEKSRSEKTDELAQSRSRVAHIEEHTQRLAAQAKELLERAKAIDEGKKLRDEDMAAARSEAAKLKAEIEKKKDELEKAKKIAPEGQEWYALIPYDGRSGTRRRPIYVECTEFGIVIQPEGLRLTSEDFNGPLGPGNPLDSALRAIRDYWERTAGTKAAQPYPLLVVRPSGVVAFGAAKAAISAWDDEWGYELISDDKNLDFGPPDPNLNAALNKSVTVARQRQAAMIAMMPRRFQGDEPLKSFTPEPTIGVSGSRYLGGSGSGASGLGGGTGVGSGGVGSGGVGNGPGAGGGGTGYGSGTGSGSGSGTTAAGGGMARGGVGNGLSGGIGGGVNQPSFGSGVGGGLGYGTTGPYPGGGAPGGNGSGSGGSGSGFGANGTGNGGSGGNVGGGGNGSGGSGIPSVAAAWNSNTATADQRFGAANRGEPGMIGAGGGAGGSDGFPGSQPVGNGVGPGGTGAGGGGYGTGGQGGSGQYAGAASGQTAGGTAGGAGGGQFGNTSGGQSGGGDPFGSSGSASGSSSSAGSGSQGGGSQGGGSPLGGGSSMTSSGGGMGIPSFTFGSPKNSPGGGTGGAAGGKTGSGSARSTAKRGSNWGLPQAKTNSIGVTRPIHISIEPNRVVMYPERGDNRAPKTVPIAPELSPDDVTHFVDAVQNEVKGWGVAVADGYWKPVLRADIAPGAERQFMNLETALHGSGIEVTRR